MSERTSIKQIIEDNFNWDERTDLDTVLATIEQLVLESTEEYLVVSHGEPMITIRHLEQALKQLLGGKKDA